MHQVVDFKALIPNYINDLSTPPYMPEYSLQSEKATLLVVHRSQFYKAFSSVLYESHHKTFILIKHLYITIAYGKSQPSNSISLLYE